MNAGAPSLSTWRLHGYAALLDIAGLALLFLQALYWIQPQQASHAILGLVAATPFIALVVFALVPRRAGLGPDAEMERRTLLVYGNLGFPVAFSLLTLLLVGLSGSFDSFAGFALLVAADAGRNLREALWRGLAKRLP